MDRIGHETAEFFRRTGYWRGEATVPASLLAGAREALANLAWPDTHGVRFDDQGRVTHVDGVVDRDRVFFELATHPAVLEPLTWLVGPNVDLVRNRHNHATRTYPDTPQKLHRDVLQWSRPVVTAIVYLQDTPVEMGPTQLVPGSQFLPFVGTPNNGGTWMDEHHTFARLAPQEVALPMPAGGVLLFDGLVFHRAGLNTTGRVREAVTFGYHAVDELATVDDPSLLLVAGERLRRGNRLLAAAATP